MAGFDPYAADEAGLARKQKMADLLGGQAMQPIEQFGYGGIPAPISPAAGLAKVLQAWGSRRKSGQVEQGTTALNQRKGADTTADYSDLAAAMKTGKMDPSTFGNYRTPEGRDRAFSLYENQLKAAASSGDPSAVREYQYFAGLPDDNARQQYLLVKRANNPVNLGDERAVMDPLHPGQVLGAQGIGAPPKTEFDNTNNRMVTAPAIPGAVRPGTPGAPQLPPLNVSPGAGAAPTAPAAAPAPAAQLAPGPAVQGPAATQLPPRQVDMEKANKLQGAYNQWKMQSQLVTGTIDKALGAISGWSTGLPGAVLQFGPTQARELRNDLETIKANIGFDKLQTMRENSPTGGALGAVSDTEQRLLQAVNGALDPMMKDQLGANLKQIKALYSQLLMEKDRAFQADQRILGGGGQPGGAPPAAGPSIDDLLTKYGPKANGGP